MPNLPLRIASALVKYRFIVLAGTMLSATALPLWSSASGQASQDGRIILAETADEKKKKAEADAKAKAKPQPKPQVQPQPKPQPKPQVQPQPKPQPKPQVQPQPKPQPKPQVQPQPKPQPKPQVQPQPKIQPKQDLGKPKSDPQIQKGPVQVQPQPKVQPKQDLGKPKSDPQIQKGPVLVQPQPKVQPKQDLGKPKSDPQIQKGPVQVQPQPKVQPKQDLGKPKSDPQIQKGPVLVAPPAKAPPPAKAQDIAKPKFVPQQDGKQFVLKKGATQQGNVNQIKQQRKEQVVGGQRIIIEPGGRRIITAGGRIIIRNDDSARLRRFGNARFEVRGRERFTILQRGPYQIVTVTDANGNLLRRFRRYPNGREVVFIDNRPRFGRTAVGVGAVALFLGLAAPAILIPRDRYIVNAVDASPTLLYETLDAPPMMAMERPYTLDEVRYNVELRDRVRSIDLNTINFSTGSWEITPDQYPQLQAIAQAILKLLSENADTVIMVEGHADGVGQPDDNMSLSDRRAEAVAEILTSQFQIPPENLVTQGYGSQHLRVPTQGPNRENRRVQIRNVTALLGQPQDQDPNAPPDQDGLPDDPGDQNPGQPPN